MSKLEKIRIQVNGQWTDIAPSHFDNLMGSEFRRIQAVEFTEIMTRDEYKKLRKETNQNTK